MNLNLLPDLALFVQIVDQGSFSAVARQNGITPSAVSRSVSRLEREMGCKLLQRTTRKLRLNDAGETVYQHAQQMLEAARQAMDSAGSRQTATRTWTSACGWKIALSILSMTVLIWRYASPIPPPPACTANR